ncbi:hypothetical protein B0O99DRAFT_626091 [Bisporella sp. PMI_857]|nr:hypothetical protein B0O99DRAFT_626091 [Bisporella sp. PMI_857]
MYTSTILSAIFLAVGANAIALPRQADACFIIGNSVLPQEVIDTVDSIKDVVTCGTGTTIGNSPDVTSGDVTFSDINFEDSNLSPLGFALSEFATADPLADTDLTLFQNRLNTYLATEASLRSVSGSLAIKVPKFFLSFQIARIKTAQGIEITDAGQTVEHLLGKVTKNAAGESADLLNQVTDLSTTLA